MFMEIASGKIVQDGNPAAGQLETCRKAINPSMA
jgi:hypothetical protein